VWSKDRELVSLNRAFNRMLTELEWRQQHLVRSEKLASLGTLLFGVAHDLNNPLSNISTSTQILREEMDGADTAYKKELVAQIEEETDRARDIVRSLLDFSKTGAREATNLEKTVNDAIRFIKNEVPPKIEIGVKVPPAITVFADRQQLQQVFLNLIKNAVEAIPGEGRISISARKAKDHAEIKFADTGAGIEPGMVSKIFDPFFTTKGTKTGYGLGLFIVHNIIEEHGGTIDVGSEVGRGTTFLIKLPLKEPEKDAG
jgi:signal transduction histidine kinase